MKLGVTENLCLILFNECHIYIYYSELVNSEVTPFEIFKF